MQTAGIALTPVRANGGTGGLLGSDNIYRLHNAVAGIDEATDPAAKTSAAFLVGGQRDANDVHGGHQHTFTVQVTRLPTGTTDDLNWGIFVSQDGVTFSTVAWKTGTMNNDGVQTDHEAIVVENCYFHSIKLRFDSAGSTDTWTVTSRVCFARFATGSSKAIPV